MKSTTTETFLKRTFGKLRTNNSTLYSTLQGVQYVTRSTVRAMIHCKSNGMFGPFVFSEIIDNREPNPTLRLKVNIWERETSKKDFTDIVSSYVFELM